MKHLATEYEKTMVRYVLFFCVCMGLIDRYIGYRKGTTFISGQGFGRHFLRYWVAYMILMALATLGAGWFAQRRFTQEKIDGFYTKASAGIQQLYPDELQITYTPTSGVATNSSGPVVWTMSQIHSVFGPQKARSGFRADAEYENFLVIDPSAQIDDYSTYKTMLLVTRTHLVANSPQQLKIIPLLSTETQISTGITATGVVLTQERLDSYLMQGSQLIKERFSSIKKILLAGGVGSILFFVPLIAALTTLWLTLGMVIVTWIGRLVSKLWVRVSRTYLFTGLSLLYLPLHFVLRLGGFFLDGLSTGFTGYLIMVACLAVLIIHEEKQTHKDE